MQRKSNNVLLQKMKKHIGALLLFVSFFGQAQNTTPIPLPNDVVHGTLENGMRYFIYNNKEPKNRVSFYFAQQVGAILEEDDEDGLAHFLEHMAFNGSKNFKGRQMSRYLESKGLLFGRDLNAYTSLDETVYNIDDVNASDEELIDQCLLILHDWSGFLLLQDTEIDNERGVIEEEWRSRRDANMRLSEKKNPVLFANSKYAKRDIIGDQKFIQSFPYKSLRNYYTKWYRPDLQAVIVVGDIDTTVMEEKIKQRFSSIPLPKNAIERPYYDVPENKTTAYLLATDPEAYETVIEWAIKEQKAPIKNQAYLRNILVENLFANLLNNRFGEVLQRPDAHATDYFMGYSDLTLSTMLRSLQIFPKNNQELAAFEEAYSEIARVVRYGFLQSEIDRAKQNLIVQANVEVENASKQSNRLWASLLSAHFLQGNPVFKPTEYRDFLMEVLPSVTAKELSAIAKQFLKIQKSTFFITGKESKAIAYPSQNQILDVIKNVNVSKIQPYVDTVETGPLVTDELPLTPIAETFNISAIPEAKGYVLSNGAKIILKPSKKDGDGISLYAFSKGGMSKVPLADLPSALFSTGIVQSSGLGKFNATDLQKKLVGKVANVSTSIQDYIETIVGNTNITDFETMLQLVYLNFTAPRFDEAIFNSNIAASKENLINFKENPDYIFSDSLSLAINGYHPRKPVTSIEFLNQVDFSKSKALYKQRFSNAADFKFIFTGNFNIEEALPMLQRYIGNLPTSNITENWENITFGPRKGDTKVHFTLPMSNPQTSIAYQLSFTKPYSLVDKLKIKLIAAILQTRYTDTIREEEGGSYGVSVTPTIQRNPGKRHAMLVAFNCNPDKEAAMLKIVKNELRSIIKKGPSCSYLEKVKSNMLKDRQESMEQDYFWSQVVLDELLYNDKNLSMTEYKKLLSDISVRSIKEFAKKHFPKADTVEVVMNPKTNSK